MAAASEQWYKEEESEDDREDTNDNVVDLNSENMLRYASVTAVSALFRSKELNDVFKLLADYSDETNAVNTLTKDDAEYDFVRSCSAKVLQIEVEKTKIHKFIRDHYALRFAELAALVPDSVSYTKTVKVIGNDMTMTGIIDELNELVPTQITCAIIASASTTQGRDLTSDELATVMEASSEMIGLEEAKQVLLEYIQTRMVLICPNLCAFLGTGITSQIFAIAGSVTDIAGMDATDLANLGSQRSMTSGFKIRTAGFMINVDLVSCHPPELRMKALRLVAGKAITLARIDDNRRAADNSDGLKARSDAKYKMLQWTDPIVQEAQSRQRGLSNKTYERRTRKRASERIESDRQRKAVSRMMRTR